MCDLPAITAAGGRGMGPGGRGVEGWSAFMWCGLEIQILKTIAVFYAFTVKGHCLQQAEYLTFY